MKKFLLILLALMLVGPICKADEVRKGNTYVEVKKETKSIKTKYTYVDGKNRSYTIYLSANGRAYVNKISAKTGKEYKYYLSEETSRSLCKEYNVEYKEKK